MSIRRLKRLFSLAEEIQKAADPATAISAGVLRSLAVLVLLWCVLSFTVFLPFFVARKGVALVLTIELLTASLASLYLLRRIARDPGTLGSPPAIRRAVRRAGWILVAAVGSYFTLLVILNGGIESRALLGFIGVIVAAGGVLGESGALISSSLFIVFTLVLAILESRGVHLPLYLPGPPITSWSIVVFAVSLTTAPLVEASAAFRRVLALNRQKTEDLERLGQALGESEERLRTIVETTPDAIFIADLSGNVVEANAAALRQLGYSRAELLGMHVTDFVAPEFRARAQSRFPGLDGSQFYESRHVSKDGVEVPVELNTRKILFRGELALLGVARDISERKRALAQQASLESELHQAQKLEGLGRLAGGVAHDFNNLLVVVDGYGEMLLRRLQPDSPLRKYAEQIRKAGQAGAELVRQLLAFSRKQPIQLRPLDLNHVVEDTAQMLHQLVGEDVEVALRLQPSLGTIWADSGQIQQILMNLAANSRDAMPRGGRIVIETSSGDADRYLPAGAHGGLNHDAGGPLVRLTFSDTGTGMSAATQQQMFDPFFTTKEAGRGTGLGLSTVYGIVQQSRARISVSTELGKGTAVHILFPQSDTAADSRQPAPPDIPGVAGQGTILVVEDRDEVRALMIGVLELHGFQVLETSNAKDALQLTAGCAGRIDLLLTDVVMPGGNGVELADAVRRAHPETKVMFISGYPDNVLARRGVETLGAAFLPKPFTPSVLLAKVREVLASAEMR